MFIATMNLESIGMWAVDPLSSISNSRLINYLMSIHRDFQLANDVSFNQL